MKNHILNIRNSLFGLFLIAALAPICLGQNIVANPGFENVVCPTGYGQISNATGWSYAFASDGSSDLLHACHTGGICGVPGNFWGSSWPHSGNGYAHAGSFLFSDSNTEYILGHFNSPMVAGKCYYVEFWVKRTLSNGLQSSLNFAVRGIGAYISAFPPQQSINIYGNPHGYINVQPQIVYDDFLTDHQNWVKVSGTYKAQGGEQFITIGNFAQNLVFNVDYIVAIPGNSYNLSNAQVGYFFDDVLVEETDGCANNVYIEDVVYGSGNQTTEQAMQNVFAGTDVGIPNVAGPVEAISSSEVEYIAGESVLLKPGFSTSHNINGEFIAYIDPYVCDGNALPYAQANAGHDTRYPCGYGPMVLGGPCISPNDYHWYADPSWAIQFLNTDDNCNPILNVPDWVIQGGLTEITFTQVVNQFSCSPSYDQIVVTLTPCDGKGPSNLKNKENRVENVVEVVEEKDIEILAIPNPASDITKITVLHFDSKSTYTAKVYNVMGQEITSFILDGNETMFDMTGLEEGVYLVVVNNETGSSFCRIVKSQ